MCNSVSYLNNNKQQHRKGRGREGGRSREGGRRRREDRGGLTGRRRMGEDDRPCGVYGVGSVSVVILVVVVSPLTHTHCLPAHTTLFAALLLHTPLPVPAHTTTPPHLHTLHPAHLPHFCPSTCLPHTPPRHTPCTHTTSTPLPLAHPPLPHLACLHTHTTCHTPAHTPACPPAARTRTPAPPAHCHHTTCPPLMWCSSVFVCARPFLPHLCLTCPTSLSSPAMSIPFIRFISSDSGTNREQCGR